MNQTFRRICELVKERKVGLSVHGYTRIDKRGILIAEIVSSVLQGEVIEDYPEAYIGPSVLVLQTAENRQPLHVVWGIEKATTEPAVIITAYYPEPAQWSADFRRRI